MIGKMVGCFVAAGIALISFKANAKRPVPEYLKSAVVYQIVLRNFTRGGDFNEGTDVGYLARAFDSCYAFPFSFALREFVVPETPVRFKGRFYKGETLLEIMDSVRAYEATVPSDALMFAFADNHDTAFDDGEMRMDRLRPVEAGNALFTLMFLRWCLPLIYNEEVLNGDKEKDTGGRCG